MRYQAHLCFEVDATPVERRLQFLELHIDRESLPRDFVTWLGAHEAEVIRHVLWDALRRYCDGHTAHLTSAAVSCLTDFNRTH